MEDLGGPLRRSAPADKAAAPSSAANAISASGKEHLPMGAPPKEMLSPPLRAALSKQGYKLVGV